MFHIVLGLIQSALIIFSKSFYFSDYLFRDEEVTIKKNSVVVSDNTTQTKSKDCWQ